MRHVLLAVLLLTVAGCAERAARRDQALQRRAWREQCQQAIEVFPPGMQPQRPYRVIGPIEAHWNLSVDARFKTLRQKACEMGADAIMDAADNVAYRPGATTTYVDAWGRPAAVVEQPGGGHRYAAATAIAYTDVPPPAPGY